jgi:WS/DGAT/MGAT family acyltransferase
MGQGLDYSRPLWCFYLVENFGQGSAVIARLHHCLADGMALVRVLFSIADAPPGSVLPEPQAAGAPSSRNALGRLGKLPGQAPTLLKSSAQIAGDLARQGRLALNDPSVARQHLRQGVDLAAAIGRLVLRWPDPRTIFKGPLSTNKRAAWSAPLPLADVKLVGRTFGATVNDVLLAAVAGALGRYLDYWEEPVDGVKIRAVVPVNLRPLDDSVELGNRFGLVFCALPIGEADPIQRLRAVKWSIDEIKATPEAIASYGILGVLGAAPNWLQQVGVAIFDAKGSAVMTNVPGPRQPLSVIGVPLNTVMAWVPQAGRVSLGVSIISYNGNVFLGIASDERQVPDPGRVIAYFSAEFEDMRARAEQGLSKRRASIQAMLDSLDESLNVLDEVYQASVLPATCQAQTRAGAPCKNRPLPGKRFCRVHDK